MKRSGFLQRKTPLRGRPRSPAEKPPRALPAPIPLEHRRPATMALCTEPARPAPKDQSHRSAGWLGAVRSLACCVLCGRPGVEPAHRNEGKAMASKVHDCWTAALCRDCHREIDQGKTLTREQRRAEIDRAIVLTLAELVQAGKVGLL